MNAFNRITVIFLLVVLLLVAVLLAIFPTESLSVAQRSLGMAGDYVQWVAGSQFGLFVLARVLLGLLALAICGWLLVAELRRQPIKTIQVHTAGGSLAVVTADSVARRLTWHINQLADVVSVTPRVSPHRQSVDVMLDLQTSPDIEVPMKTDEVVQCARDIIVERMGLQAGRIQVRVTHVPYREEA